MFHSDRAKLWWYFLLEAPTEPWKIFVQSREQFACSGNPSLTWSFYFNRSAISLALLVLQANKMASMLVVGAMSSIDATQVSRHLSSVPRCQVVLDYGGFNMVHHKVSHKKPLHAHGHAKPADDAPAQAESSLIQAPLSARVNKKQKRSSLNHSVPVDLPPHRRQEVVSIQVRAQAALPTSLHHPPVVVQALTQDQRASVLAQHFHLLDP